MVTLPATAAEDPALIPELVGAGMDLARINCAQDAQRPCRIAMDLTGPKLWIPALTAKDRVDLAFACQHADLVNYSFVRSEADIACFYRALAASGETCDGLVLKIEIHQAFLQPAQAAAGRHGPAHPPGGDDRPRRSGGGMRLGCPQCHSGGDPAGLRCRPSALHLGHHGTPTRPEIIDAAMGARGGLMLNKGANISEALRTLRRIMADSGICCPDHSTDQAERLLSCHCF
jgi:pyruvate kinase